jgi:hypothetical protein
MHLIMLNAMTYNQKGSEIWTWAKELQAILKKEEQVETDLDLDAQARISKHSTLNP